MLRWRTAYVDAAAGSGRKKRLRRCMRMLRPTSGHHQVQTANTCRGGRQRLYAESHSAEEAVGSPNIHAGALCWTPLQAAPGAKGWVTATTARLLLSQVRTGRATCGQSSCASVNSVSSSSVLLAARTPLSASSSAVHPAIRHRQHSHGLISVAHVKYRLTVHRYRRTNAHKP